MRLLRVESVSFSPLKLQPSASAGLQSQIPWGLLLPFSDPQAGEPEVGLRTATPVGEPQVTVTLRFVGCPPGGHMIWCYYDGVPSYCVTVAAAVCLDVELSFV